MGGGGLRAKVWGALGPPRVRSGALSKHSEPGQVGRVAGALQQGPSKGVGPGVAGQCSETAHTGGAQECFPGGCSSGVGQVD